VTTDHFVPFHFSARVPPGPFEVAERPPTAAQLLALAQETPRNVPAAEAASCRGAAIAAGLNTAISSPAASDAPAARVPPRPVRPFPQNPKIRTADHPPQSP
jgi:hypothetical protein